MEKELDMRIRKTYLSLTNALLAMMQEMPFEDIRVKELCDRAMIRKSTFYKHFADKYELLSFVVREIMENLDSQLLKEQDGETPREYYTRLIAWMFDFVAKNERLIRSTESSGNLAVLLQILSEQVTPNLQKKFADDLRAGYKMPASPEVMASFFAGAVAECIRHWLTHGKKPAAEELQRQMAAIIDTVYGAENPQQQ